MQIGKLSDSTGRVRETVQRVLAFMQNSSSHYRATQPNSAGVKRFGNRKFAAMYGLLYKRESQEKQISRGRNFSCFPAHLIEQELS